MIRVKKIGAAPGSLIHLGEKRVDQARLSLIAYGPDGVDEEASLAWEDCSARLDRRPVSWINLTGLHNVELIARIGADLGIHPLDLEDILNTGHRPKMAVGAGYTLLILKMLTFNAETLEMGQEQVSFLQLQNAVISFQEKEGDVFGALRDRIRAGSGRLRQRGTDYLLYALADSVVDSYLATLSDVSSVLAGLEEDFPQSDDREFARKLHSLRRCLSIVRNATWPLREVLDVWMDDENPIVAKESQPFLSDLRDHVLLSLDMVERLRSELTTLHELHLAEIGARTNEVMQVLTVMASLFIPLTFIVGIYGMNFENMPELKWTWGYPAVWLVMLATVVGLLLFFKRKKWF